MDYSKMFENNLQPYESFCYVFYASLDALLETSDITKTDICVLAKLTNIMDYGNEVPQMTKQQLAELVGIKRPKLSKSLKRLLKHGVVIKDGKKLTVNPQYYYKGNLFNRHRALEALKSKYNPEPDALPEDQFKELETQPANNVSNENHEPTKPFIDAHAKWLDWLDNLIDNNISKDNSTPKASLPFDEKDIPF
ncbi:helix-turn-helix domain-containing protein [Anaerobiospirillum sp. NML120511]|uniref:helix-turn-helix domain-containing protein n=1 Tax=Anaerobiospirillum sp. NML120511 TaxID=2932819 RepID=UPI001FF263D5|nr:helix-turn-helix domain-containing protein [Anaerobiospirillum sp. NML120511]MCK0535753.1 hypothetical protein [Anaerobiospirillum sp. NML120511]